MTKIISLLVVFVSSLASADPLPFPVLITPSAQELSLSPLLDLHNGGQAAGAAQGKGPTLGSLIDGTELPARGTGYVNAGDAKSDWGSGLMISFILNAAASMSAQYPGNLVYVGAIAQPQGGPYAPHQSHQNGLDADILFMGATNYDSVLDKDGNVTSRFETEKNWSIWRLATSQQIVTSVGQTTTAVSMILVDPRLKNFVCAWAKSHEAALEPLDYEVLRRLRPTAGHFDHFHLRFKCSPHYASCLNGGDSRSTLTGCAEFDQAPQPH